MIAETLAASPQSPSVDGQEELSTGKAFAGAKGIECTPFGFKYPDAWKTGVGRATELVSAHRDGSRCLIRS